MALVKNPIDAAGPGKITVAGSCAVNGSSAVSSVRGHGATPSRESTGCILLTLDRAYGEPEAVFAGITNPDSNVSARVVVSGTLTTATGASAVRLLTTSGTSLTKYDFPSSDNLRVNWDVRLKSFKTV